MAAHFSTLPEYIAADVHSSVMDDAPKREIAKAKTRPKRELNALEPRGWLPLPFPWRGAAAAALRGGG